MRHVLLPGAPAASTGRMIHPTAAARLVAPAGGALSLMPSLPRTAAGTVNLAAIAAAADQYLRLAASAQEQPGRPFRRLRRAAAWTPSATGGIMPRHACSAPCGARRRTRAWQFRSAPCLPIGRLSLRHCALDNRCSAGDRGRGARRPVDMWTTQERCPHTHRRKKRQHKVDFALKATPSRRGQVRLTHATPPDLRGSRQPFTREPVVGQPLDPLPGHPIFLAPPLERSPPEIGNVG